MILTYYPDTDTLDVRFYAPSERTYDTQRAAVEAAGEVAEESSGGLLSPKAETHEADPSGQTLAHYKEGRLEEMTIEHASRRAPKAWEIESLRREAAKVAASTGRVVESVTHDLIRDRTSFQTGELGPQSAHTSDDAVQNFTQMIDEIEAGAAA